LFTFKWPFFKAQLHAKCGRIKQKNNLKQRFLQEAQAASALDHPNICTIFEISETEDGQLYLVMAYYEGETLKQRIERGLERVNVAL
jgi:serine/threonine protein kinase